MGENTKGKEINFTPLSGYLITTCHLELEDFKYTLGEKQPKIKQIQKVVSVGDNTTAKVGDYVMIDHQKYIKHVKTKSTIRAGIGGEDMIKEEFVPPFIAVPGQTEPLLKIYERDIEGYIDNFDQLDQEFKDFMTMVEYEEGKLKAQKEFENKKKEFHAEKNKNIKEVDRKGPMIITETTKTRV